MNQHPTFENLSAYIDGEVPDPETIAAHIQSCADCARQHMELAKLSHHVRALEAPEVTTAFARNVLAAVEEAPTRRPFRFALPWAVPLAAAAVLALIFLNPFAAQEPSPPASTPELPAPTALAAEPMPLPDGQSVVELLEMALVRDPDIESLLTDLMIVETEPLEVSAEDMLMALASEAWFVSFADDERWGTDPDLDTTLKELDAAETKALADLLIESARGDFVL